MLISPGLLGLNVLFDLGKFTNGTHTKELVSAEGRLKSPEWGNI